MGQRGALKIVPGGGRVAVAEAAKGSAAARVSPMAPHKPDGVAKDDELSKLWDEVVPELDKAGLLSTADVMTVELALRHMQAIRLAYSEMMEGGAAVVDPDNEERVKKNPADAIFRYHSRDLMEIAKQLGMTWMARARTAVPEENRGSENPFDSGAASTSG